MMNKPDRTPLPDRRLAETRRVETPQGHTTYVTIGYDPASPVQPREVFSSGGFRSGGDVEYHLQDLRVLNSMLLQHGVEATKISHSISRRASALGGEEYASLGGWLLEAVNVPPSWSDQYATASEEASE